LFSSNTIVGCKKSNSCFNKNWLLFLGVGFFNKIAFLDYSINCLSACLPPFNWLDKKYFGAAKHKTQNTKHKTQKAVILTSLPLSIISFRQVIVIGIQEQIVANHVLSVAKDNSVLFSYVVHFLYCIGNLKYRFVVVLKMRDSFS